ncbi:unnamed protein product, partial [marine sediment metagenome]
MREKLEKKIKNLGRMMRFNVDEEWTPSTLREKARADFYISCIDMVWFKQCNPVFVKFLSVFKNQNVLASHKD